MAEGDRNQWNKNAAREARQYTPRLCRVRGGGRGRFVGSAETVGFGCGDRRFMGDSGRFGKDGGGCDDGSDDEAWWAWVRARARRERAAQGLGPEITDVSTLEQLVMLFGLDNQDPG
ncbi:hypothetical protein [Lipingzhangella halophila]|uniref:hypothetical protein n=1 Tax=Lipingzhangella halophila TaxID=1783352 RepID=UPI001621E16B|nr:hypothetical protein [Lipingzhangella halophila]